MNFSRNSRWIEKSTHSKFKECVVEIYFRERRDTDSNINWPTQKWRIFIIRRKIHTLIHGLLDNPFHHREKRLITNPVADKENERLERPALILAGRLALKILALSESKFYFKGSPRYIYISLLSFSPIYYYPSPSATATALIRRLIQQDPARVNSASGWENSETGAWKMDPKELKRTSDTRCRRSNCDKI